MVGSSARRVFLKLRQFRIHRGPRGGVGGPNFMLRFVNARIIQRPRRDALSELAFATEQPRAALRTKTADVVTHHLALGVVIFWRSFRDLEPVRRRVEDGR